VSYTRNFEFRVPPHSGQRAGRYAIDPAGSPILIGAPIKVDPTKTHTGLGVPIVILATGATAPVSGQMGICVFEFKGDEGYAGVDPYLNTYSDLAMAPAGQAVQLVSGDSVKVSFRNTNAVTFLGARAYPNRTMVSEGGGATPNVDVGNFLTPGTGNDTAGYWAVTASATNAWLVVTGVDDQRSEVEARFLF
jgi:hypothetical protein